MSEVGRACRLLNTYYWMVFSGFYFNLGFPSMVTRWLNTCVLISVRSNVQIYVYIQFNQLQWASPTFKLEAPIYIWTRAVCLFQFQNCFQISICFVNFIFTLCSKSFFFLFFGRSSTRYQTFSQGTLSYRKYFAFLPPPPSPVLSFGLSHLLWAQVQINIADHQT